MSEWRSYVEPETLRLGSACRRMRVPAVERCRAWTGNDRRAERACDRRPEPAGSRRNGHHYWTAGHTQLHDRRRRSIRDALSDTWAVRRPGGTARVQDRPAEARRRQTRTDARRV